MVLPSDENTGLDSSHTWLTINKLTSAGLKPGDTVRFKGGDTLTGAASVYTEFTNYWPSKKIVFNSYGSGKATLRNLNNALCISIGYTNVTKFEIRNFDRLTISPQN